MAISFDPSTTTLLGGISLTHLSVYDAVSPDGLMGGSPHVHLACSEAYFVVGGTGAVEFLTATDGFWRVELTAGKVVHFEPGVLHRLVNEGGLEILVLMQNAGLPEHGDAVLTFPPADLGDPEIYAQRARIRTVADAVARRDRAVEGFTELKHAFVDSPESGRRRLDDFYRAAERLVGPRAAEWREIVRRGPEAAVDDTLARLEALAAGKPVELEQGRVSESQRGDERLGMCGRLQPVLGPAAAAVDAAR